MGNRRAAAPLTLTCRQEPSPVQLVAALLPGSPLKSKPESRRFAREEDGSDSREQQQVITCKRNSNGSGSHSARL